MAGTSVTVAATSAAAEEVRPGDMLYLPSESADGLHDPWRVIGVRRESGAIRLTLRREARASDRELSLSTAEPVLMQPRPGAGTETPVLLSIPIERLEPGMLVPSRDPSSGRDTLRRIAQTFVRTVQQTVTLVLADDAGRVVDTITGTTEHPFFTADGRALPMAALGIGTSIVTQAGPSLRVAAVRRERVPAGVRVYNLEVAGDHTYFAGGGGAWVHNAGACPVRVGRWMSRTEHEKMLESGRVQSTLDGLDQKSVTVPPNPAAFGNAEPGSVFVEFDVPSAQLT